VLALGVLPRPLLAACEIPTGALAPPLAEGGQTIVDVGLNVLDISQVDDLDQSFVADIFITAWWQDPRLAAVAINNGAPCVFGINEVWHPGLQFLNRRGGTNDLAEVVTAHGDGKVTYAQRIYGEVASPLDLRRYPYDQQVLPVVVGSTLEQDMVRVEINPERSGASPNFTVAGWQVLEEKIGHRNWPMVSLASGEREEFPVAAYEFTVERTLAITCGRWLCH